MLNRRSLLTVAPLGVVAACAGESAVGTQPAPPVSAATGLWYFPGMLILIGPIIWFVKTNGALNDYWKSQGATA